MPSSAGSPISCAELESLLSTHVPAKLTADQRAAAAAHTAECEACRERWGSDTVSLQLHVAAEPEAGGPGVHGGVMARLQGEAPPGTTEVQARPGGTDKIAGYEILGVLGRGGMGVVYKARQVSVDRIVALKVLSAGLARDGTFHDRFVREARAAAAVNHPGIVDVYDVGLDGETHYIAMEYVEGPSLEELVKQEGRLPIGRALGVMEQVTAALAEAHDAGVLHRDIKPSNILLSRKGQAKVADFGLAKRPATDLSLTETGHTMGTPLYLPPEAARGESLDARSDLYSLGATFYHLLAGRPPFEGNAFLELALRHVREDPPRLERLAPDTPRAVCHIIHRLLAKNPADRFQNARDLLAELRAARSTLGTAAVPSGDGHHRAEARVGSRRTTATRVALAIGVCLLAAVVVVLARRPSRVQPTEVWDPLRAPGADGWRSLLRADSLDGWQVATTDVFSKHGPVRVDGDCLLLEGGQPDTGVAWQGAFPTEGYEVCMEALRLYDAPCCEVVFPVGESHCMLVVGGWEEGAFVALADVDNVEPPSENASAAKFHFQLQRWCRVYLRVTTDRVEVTLDGQPVINLPVAQHRFSLPTRWQALKPFGLGSAAGREARLRNIKLRQAR